MAPTLKGRQCKLVQGLASYIVLVGGVVCLEFTYDYPKNPWLCLSVVL